jgi:hypothetical protein
VTGAPPRRWLQSTRNPAGIKPRNAVQGTGRAIRQPGVGARRWGCRRATDHPGRLCRGAALRDAVGADAANVRVQGAPVPRVARRRRARRRAAEGQARARRGGARLPHAPADRGQTSTCHREQRARRGRRLLPPPRPRARAGRPRGAPHDRTQCARAARRDPILTRRRTRPLATRPSARTHPVLRRHPDRRNRRARRRRRPPVRSHGASVASAGGARRSARFPYIRSSATRSPTGSRNARTGAAARLGRCSSTSAAGGRRSRARTTSSPRSLRRRGSMSEVGRVGKRRQGR